MNINRGQFFLTPGDQFRMSLDIRDIVARYNEVDPILRTAWGWS